MNWFFGLLVVIQMGFWIYFAINKKYITLFVTGLLGIFCIWSFIDSYMKYIYVDPCEGIDGCMNETGIIFVLLILLMLMTTLISLTVFIIDKNNPKKIKTKYFKNLCL